jgi:aspartyl-tRNA(Asn)/glutamyl-tRNA(Gln) amidotransferase subunit A
MNLKSARQIRDAVNDRRVSATEVAKQSLARIEAVDSTLRAFVTVDTARVLARAAEVDAMVDGEAGPLPLAGVPVAVKDNICTRDLRTTCCSKILGRYVPPYDATAVERLEAAGAVVVGAGIVAQPGEQSGGGSGHTPHALRHGRNGQSRRS